jgi:hypothetical protein
MFLPYPKCGEANTQNYGQPCASDLDCVEDLICNLGYGGETNEIGSSELGECRPQSNENEPCYVDHDCNFNLICDFDLKVCQTKE